MRNRAPLRVLASLLVAGLVAAAGCLKSPGDTGAAGSEDRPPDGSPPGSSPEPVPSPGEAYNETVSFGPTSSPVVPPMMVKQNWTTLEITVRFENALPCGLLTSDPPQAGTAGRVTLSPPSGAPVAVAFGNVVSCTVAGGGAGEVRTTAPSQSGEWQVTVNGRGIGVSAEIVVSGS